MLRSTFLHSMHMCLSMSVCLCWTNKQQLLILKLHNYYMRELFLLLYTFFFVSQIWVLLPSIQIKRWEKKIENKKLNEIKIEKVYHFYAKAIATAVDCCNCTLVRKKFAIFFSLRLFLNRKLLQYLLCTCIAYMWNVHTTYFNKHLDRFFFFIINM